MFQCECFSLVLWLVIKVELSRTPFPTPFECFLALPLVEVSRCAVLTF